MTDCEKQPLPEGDVYTGDAAPPVVVQPEPKAAEWNWCHLITAVIGNLLCQPFGTISMVMALLAYTDHKTSDHAKSRSKRKMALGFGIAAIVVGSILTLLFMGMMWCMMKKYKKYGGYHGGKYHDDSDEWWGKDRPHYPRHPDEY